MTGVSPASAFDNNSGSSNQLSSATLEASFGIMDPDTIFKMFDRDEKLLQYIMVRSISYRSLSASALES